MRVRLADLREIHTDIAAYRARIAQTAGPQYFRLSKFRTLVYAVARYHSSGGDLAAATRYFEDLYRAHFKRQDSLDILRLELAEYARSFTGTGNTVIRSRFRVSIGIAEEIELTGEVGRLDMTTSGGYAAWLLVQQAGDWRADPRMPLLQGHFADIWDVSPARVTIGVYDFSLGQHQAVSISRTQIESARSETLALLRQLL